jgi:hypothetical protein
MSPILPPKKKPGEAKPFETPRVGEWEKTKLAKAVDFVCYRNDPLFSQIHDAVLTKLRCSNLAFIGSWGSQCRLFRLFLNGNTPMVGASRLSNDDGNDDVNEEREECIVGVLNARI